MIRLISAAETIPVRWSILRPGFPRESAIFPGDDLETTRHFGAFDDAQRLVGVASIYLAPMPEQPHLAPAWQLRGMATVPDVRGAGHGRALVDACVASAREAAATIIWCNARVAAAAFYEKCRWEILGREFDVPTVGPHFRMWRKV
jgi:GNAT superfamily N-acetyltransferase